MRVIIIDSSKGNTSLYGRERLKKIIEEHRSNIVAVISNSVHNSKKSNLWQRVINKIKKRKTLTIIDIFYKLFSVIKGGKAHWIYTETESTFDLSSIYDGPIYKVEKLNTLEVKKLILETQCDLIFHSGGLILKDIILTAPKIGVIGYHHGDIEKFRGPFPGFWELYFDEKQIGVTVQILHVDLDTGPIVLKKQFSIHSNENLKSLQRRIFWESYAMGAEAITLLKDNKFVPEKNYVFGQYRSYPNIFQVLKLVFKGKV